MKRIAIAILAGVWGLLAAFTALASPSSGDLPRPPAGTISQAARPEFWRLGVTSEGEAAYEAASGRLLSPIATFRSYRNTADMYFIFAAPGSQRTIQAARFYLLDRNGTYPDSTALTLEILSQDGTVQHIASTAAIDLEAAYAGAWTEISLSRTAENLLIMPGEFLAFHFSLSGAPAGDLIIHPLFEVAVQPPTTAWPPDLPVLHSPPDGTITTTQAITLTWKASAGASGYHVRVDNGTLVTVTDTLSPVILPIGTHTWTVQAFSSAGTSAWATPWTVEITETLPPPVAPVLLSPPNGAITSTQSIVLTWQAGQGAIPTGYRVNVDGTILTVTATTSPVVLPLGIHTWTVQAFNEAGASPWAAPRTVTVIEPPPAIPTLLSPPDGLITTTQSLTLTWAASAHASGYHVRLDNGAIITVTGTALPTVLPIGTHTWTVRAYNSAWTSAWAAPWTVEITETLPPPTTPVPLTPPDGVITTTQSIILTWQAGQGAAPTGYRVDVDGTIITVTGTTSSVVLPLGTHTWTVQAFNEAGASLWAAAWTVEVVETLPPPTLPILLAPPNGTTTSTPSATFIWQAGEGAVPTAYRVALDGQTTTVKGTTFFTLLPIGVHTWTVQAINETGASDWAAPWTIEVTHNKIFLPLVTKNAVSAPDLVVERLTAASNTVQVVIKNQGNAPVTDAFWVEGYIDPTTPPTAVNQIWSDLADQGVVWGVTEDALPLAPGSSITLTVGDAYYAPEYSQVTWPLAAGTTLYAQADSVNMETTYGAVLENHEILGEAYNNITGPVRVTKAADSIQQPDVDAHHTRTPGRSLPRRP